jgi:hypothetical protein
MSVDNYVNVIINLQSPTVAVPGFGIVLIAGTTGFGASTDLIRYYSNLDAVEADFATTTNEYKAARDTFAQNPKPDKVAIGKVPTPVAGVKTLTVSADPIVGNAFTLAVNGTVVGPVTYATSAAATMTALAAAIAAVPGVASATVAGDIITVTGVTGYDLTLTDFTATGGASQPTGTVAVTTPAVVWSTGLAAIRAVDKGWYGLIITDRTDGAILDVAAWAEANMVKFGAVSGASDILTNVTTDVFSRLKAKSYANTIPLFHAVTTEYPGAAWLGAMLAYAPGSTNWMFKTLAGITPGNLSDSQRQNVLNKNGNVYMTQSGVNMTEPGKTASGQFADVMVGLDWLKANLQADVFALFTTQKKVPYTDAGVAMIESKLRTRVKLATEAGIVAEVPAPVYTIPKVADQAQLDRAARKFPNIGAVVFLQGAIDTVGFNIQMQV